MRTFGMSDAGQYNARLTVVIDAGTNKFGNKAVYLGFQLEDFPVQPKSPQYPIYRIFAKYPYGGAIEIDDGTKGREKISSLLSALGHSDGDVLDFLIQKAGSFVTLNVTTNEYMGNISPVIADDGHSGGRPSSIDRGVDIKTFKITEETSVEEVNTLGFDKKHVKASKEYKSIVEKELEDESTEGLF